MSERSYPMESGVNLRSLRKTAPVEDAEPEIPADEPDDFAPTEADLAEARPALPPLSDLLPESQGHETDPAKWGFRGWVNAASGGLLKLAPQTPEITARAAREAVRQQWIGHQRIAVANPKGGEGVTPTALTMGNVFASERGSSVLVWDNNEAEGTLASRAIATRQEETVWDLLEHAEQLADPGADRAALSSFVRLQPTRAEVLAADEDPHGTGLIGAEQCRSIDAVLRRYRELTIIDTGNNRRRSNWLWSMYNAHLLVVPMTYREDSGRVVVRMLATLHEIGLSALVTNAIVVLTEPLGGVDPDVRSRIHDWLQRAGIRNLVEVPFDPILAGGGRIDHSKLSEPSIAAWTQVCAMAATSLAVSSQRRGRELRSRANPQSFRRPEERRPLDETGGEYADFDDPYAGGAEIRPFNTRRFGA
ncbi:MAG: hypothetical protein H5T78_03075 [Nocardia sp.]|nr:hypothetical protein [Nocardia sp.]